MRAFLCLGLTATLLACTSPVLPDAAANRPQGAAAPGLTVIDSPLVDKWLDRAGIPHANRSGQDLGSSPVAESRIMVLPLQSIHTPAAAAVVEGFLKAGGKVVALYWGTLAASGAEVSPAYRLASVLGVRPVGWLGEAPQPLLLKETGAGLYPACGEHVSLPATPAAVVEPLPGTRVVARWEGEESGALSAGRSGAAFVHGNAIYLTPALLRPTCDTNNCRELFFWALQRVAPEVGPALQAKDRIATAAQLYSGATSLLTPASTTADRTEANNVLIQLAEARALLGKGSPVRASLAADHARTMAERLAERLRQSRPAAPGQS